MKDAIRVGIIGVGGTIGSTTAVLAAEPNVELVALADPDPNRRKRVLDGIKGVRVFDDYRQMFDACDLDAVCIGLPTWMHAPVSQEAVELGLHVLCEKPPSNDAAELIPVTQLAATKGLAYQGYLVFGSDLGFRSQMLRFSRNIASTARSYSGKMFTHIK